MRGILLVDSTSLCGGGHNCGRLWLLFVCRIVVVILSTTTAFTSALPGRDTVFHTYFSSSSLYDDDHDYYYDYNNEHENGYSYSSPTPKPLPSSGVEEGRGEAEEDLSALLVDPAIHALRKASDSSNPTTARRRNRRSNKNKNVENDQFTTTTTGTITTTSPEHKQVQQQEKQPQPIADQGVPVVPPNPQQLQQQIQQQQPPLLPPPGEKQESSLRHLLPTHSNLDPHSHRHLKNHNHHNHRRHRRHHRRRHRRRIQQQLSLQQDDDDAYSDSDDAQGNDNHGGGGGSDPLLPNNGGGNGGDNTNDNASSLQICSIKGALGIARLRSAETRRLFQQALDDVELIREYFSEAVANGASRNNMSDLTVLRQSLDWQARNLSPPPLNDTVSANLGYSDDRPNRRMDRYVSTSPNQPLVGTKQTDAHMMETLSNILPWIVDRQTKPELWHVSHYNGQIASRASMHDEHNHSLASLLLFDSLYVAAYALSYADCVWYYPPLYLTYGRPFSLADGLGGNYNYREQLVGQGILPDENPWHKSFFFGPYPDQAHPGEPLITATAPLYYSGTFENLTYPNNTYFAQVGLDISLTDVSALLSDLENRLVPGSFALLVNDTVTLTPIVISNAVVQKLYPPELWNESVHLGLTTSDVITSANWTWLAQELPQWGSHEDDPDHHDVGGDYGFVQFPLTVTGTTTPVQYQVFYDTWDSVADWVFLLLAPVEEIRKAILLQFETNDDDINNNGEPSSSSSSSQQLIRKEVRRGQSARATVTLANRGTLNVVLDPSSWNGPKWMELVAVRWTTVPSSSNDTTNDVFSSEANPTPTTTLTTTDPLVLPHHTAVELEFVLHSLNLTVGNWSSTVSFRVEDNGYENCFYDRYIGFTALLQVAPTHVEENWLGNLVWAGYTLFGLINALALGFLAWMIRHWNDRIVRCSQPKFLVMLVTGTIIMSGAFVTLGMESLKLSFQMADRACMFTPWLISMGFIVSFSALFSKIWRINQIFHNPRFQRITVTEKDVLVPFAVMFFLNFGLLLTWTLYDPLTYQRVKVNSDNPYSDTYGTCRVSKEGTKGIVVAIAVINLSALMLACFQAYRARHICDEFSESKWVGVTVASWLQVFVVVGPVLFLVQDRPEAMYLLKISILFMACMSLLLFMFVPKIRYHRLEQQKKKNKLSNRGGRGQSNVASTGVTFTPSGTSTLTNTTAGRFFKSGAGGANGTGGKTGEAGAATSSWNPRLKDGDSDNNKDHNPQQQQQELRFQLPSSGQDDYEDDSDGEVDGFDSGEVSDVTRSRKRGSGILNPAVVPLSSVDSSSTTGYGIRIIRPEASTHEDEVVARLEEKIRSLEETVEKLKHKNKMLQVLAKKTNATISSSADPQIGLSQRWGLTPGSTMATTKRTSLPLRIDAMEQSKTSKPERQFMHEDTHQSHDASSGEMTVLDEEERLEDEQSIPVTDPLPVTKSLSSISGIETDSSSSARMVDLVEI